MEVLLNFTFLINFRIQEYLQRQNDIRQQLMEEVEPQARGVAQGWKDSANTICQETATELIKLKGHSNGKSFFVSTAHQFLEKLLHLHCPEIKRALMTQVKQFQNTIHEDCEQIDQRQDKMIQDLRQMKNPKQVQEGILGQVDKLFGYLMWIQCQGKSRFQKQNIFLQINCSLNYTCPLCIKKINNDESKSIKLIKNYSEYPQVLAEPRTMKTISLRQPDRPQKLPSLSKQSKFDSILETMKAQRVSAKKKQQTKQRKINKIWNLLGNLMQLDRENFIIDHIFNASENKQNRLLKELKHRNDKNQHYISHFAKKKRPQLLELKPQKQSDDAIQEIQQPRKVNQERKIVRSVSPKFAHRKLSVKKHVKILEPICDNIASMDFNAKDAQQLSQLSIHNPIDTKAYKIYFLGENEVLQNRPKQGKANYFHRTFKSSKDVITCLPGEDGSQFADNVSQILNKSLKLI